MKEDVRQVADGAVRPVAEREELKASARTSVAEPATTIGRVPTRSCPRGALHAASVTLEV